MEIKSKFSSTLDEGIQDPRLHHHLRTGVSARARARAHARAPPLACACGVEVGERRRRQSRRWRWPRWLIARSASFPSLAIFVPCTRAKVQRAPFECLIVILPELVNYQQAPHFCGDVTDWTTATLAGRWVTSSLLRRSSSSSASSSAPPRSTRVCAKHSSSSSSSSSPFGCTL